MGKYDDLFDEAPKPQTGGKYSDLFEEAPASSSKSIPAAQPEKPFFFSPGQIATRGAMGAAMTLPFAGALMNKVQGKDAYPTGAEGLGAKVGDVSNALLTTATLGKGLGAGAALNAGLEASGINEGLRQTGKALENAYEPKTQSVALNALLNTPAYAASTAVNFLPALLAGKMRVPETAPEPAIPPDITARAEFSKAEGIPLTKGETLGRTSPEMLKEAGLRRAPGGEKAAMEMGQTQQQAVREALAKRAEALGDPVLAGEIRQGGGMTEGRQLAGVPEAARDIRSERGAAVGAAKEALSQEIPIRSNFAKELQNEMQASIDRLSDAGPNSDRAKARQLLEGYLDHAKNVKTMGAAIRFLDDFDSAISDTMSKAKPDVKKAAFGSTRQKISAILDEAGQKLAPEAQQQLKTAKAGFAEVADPTMELRNLEETNPAALLQSISSGKKSLSKVQGFNKVFQPGSIERQGLKSALVQDIVKKGTTKEGISGSAMTKALEKLDQGTLNEIFSDNPKELSNFKDFVKGLSDIEAQRTPLGTAPAGNSHTAPLAELIKRGIGMKIPGSDLLMEKLAAYRAGKVFKPYELQQPGLAFPWLQGKISQAQAAQAQAAKQTGINPTSFLRQAIAQGQ